MQNSTPPLLRSLARLAAGSAAGALIGLAGPALADPVTVTDVAGREVKLEAPVDRIILGEGRQIYLLGVLDRDDPFQRVVG